MSHERVDLSTYAVKLSLKNIVHAILESPLEGPYPKIGTVLGNEVEVRNQTLKVDHFAPGTDNFGDKVIVFTQGRKP